MNKDKYDDIIMVSVICFAYNHEKYIVDTLESIIAQKTDFNFEIIVHDDASADGTKKIIERYAEKYPAIVRPVYQTVNQYSIDLLHVFYASFSKASGKYIAFCECDDYWTDTSKLQRQVNYMETHPGCSLCFHAARFVSTDNTFLRNDYPLQNSGLVSVAEIIEKGAAFITTNTMMYPQSLIFCNLPSFFSISAKDYALSIALALRGSVYYENEVMSAYRVFTPGSVTSTFEKSKNYRVRSARQTVKMLKAADKYSHYVYHDSFKKVIREASFPVMKNYLFPVVAKNKFLLKTWEWIKKNIRKY